MKRHKLNPIQPRVIFVGAHPDDIELGCAGTVAHFVQKGFEVLCVYLSKGEKGRQIPLDGSRVRIKESTEACQILGVGKQNIFFGKFKDTRIPDSADTIHFLEQFYPSDRAKLYAVFIPTVNEIHQDHKRVASSCITAFRYAHRILSYESPSTAQWLFNPTTFVEITPFLRLKWKALRCHASQIRQNKMYLEYRSMVHLSAVRGQQVNVKYAEAFQTIKFLL
jgi:LmbE family N-acetylglucosaminyl deacetylase